MRKLSKDRYIELKHFCLQYERFKKSAPKNAELMEQCCICAAPDWHEALLKNISKGIIYEHMPVPCGRRQFYESRSRFFLELDKRRK